MVVVVMMRGRGRERGRRGPGGEDEEEVAVVVEESHGLTEGHTWRDPLAPSSRSSRRPGGPGQVARACQVRDLTRDHLPHDLVLGSLHIHAQDDEVALSRY